MPRGVYHLALRGANLRSDQGKTVAGVPAIMLKTYEKNKQPGLKPGLAGMHAGTRISEKKSNFLSNCFSNFTYQMQFLFFIFFYKLLNNY